MGIEDIVKDVKCPKPDCNGNTYVLDRPVEGMYGTYENFKCTDCGGDKLYDAPSVVKPYSVRNY